MIAGNKDYDNKCEIDSDISHIADVLLAITRGIRGVEGYEVESISDELEAVRENLQAIIEAAEKFEVHERLTAG